MFELLMKIINLFSLCLKQLIIKFKPRGNLVHFTNIFRLFKHVGYKKSIPLTFL
jgi:hypothetical protein